MVYSRTLATSRNVPFSRWIAYSTPRQSATLQVSLPTPMKEPEEIIIAPIFDIFDAPSNLNETRDFIRQKERLRPSNITRPRSASLSITPQRARSPPTSLPPPILFDGPARPRNLPLAFHRRVDRALSSFSTSTREHDVPSSLGSSPDILVEMFEGPARITRYSHGATNRHNKSRNYLILFGLMGTLGGTVVLNEDLLHAILKEL